MIIGIIGQGYVGFHLSLALIEKSIPVIGLDVDANRVSEINEMMSCEPKSGGDFYASTDMAEISKCDVVIIAVPTGLTTEMDTDLTHLQNACESIKNYVSPDTLIINESTSFPGTLRKFIKPIVDQSKVEGLCYAAAPERVDPNNPYYNVINTTRIVSGIGEHATRRAVDLYNEICSKVVEVSSPEIAESAKLLENTYRLVNISLVNELGPLFSNFNININEVLDAAETKPFGFTRFNPSFGIGGHCIPVDPQYLQSLFSGKGLQSKLINISQEVNLNLADRLVKLISSKIGSLLNKKILIIGVTYKPNVADTRNSPAELLTSALTNVGAQVEWWDPLVNSWKDLVRGNLQEDYFFGLVVQRHDDINLADIQFPLYSINNSEFTKSIFDL